MSNRPLSSIRSCLVVPRCIRVNNDDLVLESTSCTESIDEFDLRVQIVPQSNPCIFKTPVAGTKDHFYSLLQQGTKGFRKDEVPTNDKAYFAISSIKHRKFIT